MQLNVGLGPADKLGKGSSAAAWTLAVAVIAALSTWPSWAYLHDLWVQTSDYSHGYLVATVALAWLVYRGMHLGPAVVRPSPLGTCVLAGLLLAWLIAYKATVVVGLQILAPLVVWAAIWSSGGSAIARRVAAPIGYLYFASPIWNAAAPVLQRLTVAACETALGWLGVPAIIRASLVTIPEGTFEVAESCSGTHYLVSALALASIFLVIVPLRGLRAVCFVSIAAGLSLVANWIRVCTVIYAGHATNMTSYLVATEHKSFGSALYLVLLVLIYWVGTRLARADSPQEQGTGLAGSSAQAEGSPPRVLAYPGLALLCLTFGGVLYVRSTPATNSLASLDLPEPKSNAWHGPLPPDAEWAPAFIGASRQARGQYRSAQSQVEVFIARYAQQRQGAKLISSSNTVLGGSWLTLRTGHLAGQTRGAGIPARAVVAKASGGQRWVISFVYKVGGVVTSMDIVAQLVYGTLSWTGETPAEVVAVAAKCSSSCDTAEGAVTALWRNLGDQLLEQSDTQHGV